jgi:hypothetical protein
LTVVQKPLFARHKALTVSAWNMVIGGAAGAVPASAIAQSQRLDRGLVCDLSASCPA